MVILPITEHEYTLDGGTTIQPCTAGMASGTDKGIINVGNLNKAAGQVGVRVKAATGRDASAWLYNAQPYTATTLQPPAGDFAYDVSRTSQFTTANEGGVNYVTSYTCPYSGEVLTATGAARPTLVNWKVNFNGSQWLQNSNRAFWRILHSLDSFDLFVRFKPTGTTRTSYHLFGTASNPNQTGFVYIFDRRDQFGKDLWFNLAAWNGTSTAQHNLIFVSPTSADSSLWADQRFNLNAQNIGRLMGNNVDANGYHGYFVQTPRNADIHKVRTNTTAPRAGMDADYDFAIGRTIGSANMFLGEISAIYLYKRHLTDSEATQLRNYLNALPA